MQTVTDRLGLARHRRMERVELCYREVMTFDTGLQRVDQPALLMHRLP